MAKVTFIDEKCKGCELCTTVCPKGIISMAEHINSSGFRPAQVIEMEKCIACAFCAMICPDLVIKVEK